MITYIGNASFQEVAVPAPSKAQDGMETLTRIMKGARTLLPAFVNTLAQGQVYATDYKLSTWDVDDSDPVWGQVTLNYKGVKGGAAGTMPNPTTSNSIVEASGTASYYWAEPYPWDPANDKNAVSAVADYTYYAGQSVFKYFSMSQPSNATHNTLGLSFIYVLKRIRTTVTNDDNSTTIFGLSVPVGIASALSLHYEINVVGFQTDPVEGQAYFQCEDTVRAEIVGAF